jgi:SanA protein
MFLEKPSTAPHPFAALFRRLAALLFSVLTLLILGVILCNLWICGSTHQDIYQQPKDVPLHDVGLVLGTSRFIAPGQPNPHFINRVKAAKELFESGRIRHLLVSGDNRTDYYNEPRDLRSSLIEQGVPPENISCDFAGLRTLDSVIRAKEVFGQDKLVIISDDFHVPRAVFIARAKGIDAVGLQSNRVPRSQSQRSRSREWFARVKAVLDLFVFDTAPRHIGKPEHIDLGENHSPSSAPGEITPAETPSPEDPDARREAGSRATIAPGWQGGTETP